MSVTPNILIASSPVDVHADAVKWGLSVLGYESSIWRTADFPERSLSGITVSNSGEMSSDLGLFNVPFNGQFDVVWLRRVLKPTPMSDCDKDDVEIVERESERYLINLLPYLGHAGTLWINHPEFERVADSKLRQLAVAKRVGFKIPATYMGNSPKMVRDFYAEHNQSIIYKSFCPGLWKNADESTTVLRTSRLSDEDVANDYAIAACPGIYQELIKKKYELRVTIMGDEIYAVKIDSQINGPSVDWRYDVPLGPEAIAPNNTEGDVAEGCRVICRELGLAYAAFDFIVNTNDEYVFLELNTSGQFLFIEHHVPDALLLDKFCRFILKSVSGGFSSKKVLRLADYFGSRSYLALLELETEYATRKSSRL